MRRRLEGDIEQDVVTVVADRSPSPSKPTYTDGGEPDRTTVGDGAQRCHDRLATAPSPHDPTLAPRPRIRPPNAGSRPADGCPDHAPRTVPDTTSDRA